MKITANKMTLLRMILLPLPCYLLFGDKLQQAIALVLFLGIGLTDYLDGYLARRQGPTTLGRLMDPIADKIYITALYIPLAKMEIIPFWMVLLLFVREFSITELRSIYAISGLKFHTSELARYKTSIQMTGAAFIIMIEIFGTSEWALVPISAPLAAALGITLYHLVKHGELNPRYITALGLTFLVLLARGLFHYKTASSLIMASILAITLLSGLQYLLRSWVELKTYISEQFSPSEWISFLGIGLAFPIIYISISSWREISPWIIIPLISMEFALGGLNNLLSAVNVRKSYITHTKKVLFQVFAGLAGLGILEPGLPYAVPIVFTLMLVVLTATSLYSIRLFYANRNYILSPYCVP